MQCTCKICGNPFITFRKRQTCYLCSPHPKLSSTIVVPLYEKGESIATLAKRCRVDFVTMKEYIANFGTLRQMYSKPSFYFPAVNLDLAWLDGWLLGDGCLQLQKAQGNSQATFSVKYQEYSNYFVSNWRRMGLVSSDPKQKQIKTLGCATSIYYQATTHVHPLLTKQYQRWYPEGKKRIPVDVRISPVSLREWFLGDGCFHVGKFPMFIMGGVTEGEVDMMWEKLMGIFGGVTKTVRYFNRVSKTGVPHKPNWALTIPKVKVSDFFSYIGPCPVPCYNYKWPQVDV